MRLMGSLVVAFGFAACATSERDRGFDTPPGGNDGGSFATDSSVPSSSGGPGEVYGHSDTVLYSVSTDTRAVREIGAFQGCTHVADIALDEASNMYASTGAELWLIENNTARCTRIAQGVFPNSLSFVPAGKIEAKETLVGYQGGDYVKIDRATGKVEKIGALGGGFESSGDLVSVKEGKTFLTVKGPECADCLVEIDPANGKMTKNWGSIGRADAFGLAYWGGDIYAFTDGGEVVLIKLVGDKLETSAVPVPNAPAGLKFRGAGSTTSAPVGPVK